MKEIWINSINDGFNPKKIKFSELSDTEKEKQLYFSTLKSLVESYKNRYSKEFYTAKNNIELINHYIKKNNLDNKFSTNETDVNFVMIEKIALLILYMCSDFSNMALNKKDIFILMYIIDREYILSNGVSLTGNAYMKHNILGVIPDFIGELFINLITRKQLIEIESDGEPSDFRYRDFQYRTSNQITEKVLEKYNKTFNDDEKNHIDNILKNSHNYHYKTFPEFTECSFNKHIKMPWVELSTI